MSGPSSSREARVHTQPSNRANASLAKGKSKASDDRRVVYKPVLENPYQIKPPTPLNVQNSLLACLADLLPEVAGYHLAREAKSRKRKSSLRAALHQAKVKGKSSEKSRAQASNFRKRRRDEDIADDPKRTKVDHNDASKQTTGSSSSSRRRASPGINVLGESTRSTTSASAGLSTGATNSEGAESTSQAADTPAPQLLKHCVFGINEVTKRLESQTHPSALGTTTASNTIPKPHLRFVIACRTDVDPPILIEHLPALVATCNSAIPTDSGEKMFIKLVTLPMGGEHMLAEVIGLRRIAVMALDVETPGLDRLESLLSTITPLRASWLAPPSNISQEPKELVPTHVKQLKTSAPKDMKVHREKRKREVGEAKEAAKAAAADGNRRKKRKIQVEDKPKASNPNDDDS